MPPVYGVHANFGPLHAGQKPDIDPFHNKATATTKDASWEI